MVPVIINNISKKEICFQQLNIWLKQCLIFFFENATFIEQKRLFLSKEKKKRLYYFTSSQSRAQVHKELSEFQNQNLYYEKNNLEMMVGTVTRRWKKKIGGAHVDE